MSYIISELLGGLYSGSLAILTDAAHLLTDMSSFIISLVAIHLSERPPTKKLTYGWHRAEVLGALISVEAIWILTRAFISQILQPFGKIQISKRNLRNFCLTLAKLTRALLYILARALSILHKGFREFHRHFKL